MLWAFLYDDELPFPREAMRLGRENLRKDGWTVSVTSSTVIRIALFGVIAISSGRYRLGVVVLAFPLPLIVERELTAKDRDGLGDRLSVLDR
jgi:hypothetical protein